MVTTDSPKIRRKNEKIRYLFAGFAYAQKAKASSDSGFYLSLDSCTACGAYGNQIVQLLKKDGVNAFNGYAQCSGGSCFSSGEYAKVTKIIRSKGQGSEVSVMVGPFKTLDSAQDLMGRLRNVLKPIFRGEVFRPTNQWT